MYIVDAHTISAQPTKDESFNGTNVLEINDNFYLADEPDYSDLIPKGLLRRMGKAVRMGIGAGLPLIKRHSKTDGIVIGTANGGLEDCIKFLNQIVDYDEGVLTPTNFVQSTPNALAGQLALMNENTGYNVTHVNGSLAFENALMDAELFFNEQTNASTLLIGAVEEISSYNYNIDVLAGRYKEGPVKNTELLNIDSKGSICGEGASMFVVSNKNTSDAVQILGTDQISFPSRDELNQKLISFLDENNLKPKDIDLVLLGKNGDNRTDHFYSDLKADCLPETKKLYFKSWVGDYRTVSGFATFVAYKLLNGQLIVPEFTPNNEKQQYILIYNHFDGVRHGFILLTK